MRKGSLATAVLAVLAVSACKGKDQAMDDDLARDMALASSSDGLSLAPSRGSQTVVSAEERSPEARPRVASSARSTRATPHRTPHRDHVAAHHTTEVASVAAAVPEDVPAPAPEAAAEPTQVADAPIADAPVSASPRPHPVTVGSYPGPGEGGIGTGRRGGGISIGDVIGVIGVVVIRGGTVDGDHCDPRGEHRRVNDRIPPSILHGRF